MVSTSELLVEFEMITTTVVELSLEEASESVTLVTFAVQLALKVEASMTLEPST